MNSVRSRLRSVKSFFLHRIVWLFLALGYIVLKFLTFNCLLLASLSKQAHLPHFEALALAWSVQLARLEGEARMVFTNFLQADDAAASVWRLNGGV